MPELDSATLRIQPFYIVAKVTVPIISHDQILIVKALKAPILNLESNEKYLQRKSTAKDLAKL